MERLRTLLAVLLATLIGGWGWLGVATLPRFLGTMQTLAQEDPRRGWVIWLFLASIVFSSVFAIVAAWRLVSIKGGAVWFWLIAVGAMLVPTLVALARGAPLSWTYAAIFAGVALVTAAMVFVERRA